MATLSWLFLCISACICSEISWNEYKIKYQLNFENSDEDFRRSIFEKNVEYIETENSKDHTYQLGVNHFAHLTRDEMKKMFMTPQQVGSEDEQEKSIIENFGKVDEETVSPIELEANLDVDWRRYNYVTSVKSQGTCGACYTFGVTANLESARAMNTKILEDLSAQQVLDCGFNFGCSGGSDINSYGYLMLYGSMTWKSYPYVGKKGPCKFMYSKVVARPRHLGLLFQKTEAGLTNSIMKRPTTVRLHSDVPSFLFYRSGVYEDPACTPSVIDHLAIMVGVVQNSTHNYYILKNSWSTAWGIDGYMHLGKRIYNLCGVYSLPSYLDMY